MSRHGLLLTLTLTLLAPHAGAESLRLLALPVVGEDADPRQTAEVHAGLDEGLSVVPGLERVPSAGPTFCVATDTSCIAAAGRAAKAAQVVHSSLRSLGGTLAVTLVLVGSDGRAPRRLTESIASGRPIRAAVAAAVVRLVAPERWVGALQVEGADGAEVWVDGEASATTTGRVEGLVPGQHLVRVVRAGQREARGEIEVRYAETTRARVEPNGVIAMLGFGPAGDAPVEGSPAPAEVAPAARPGEPAAEPAAATSGRGWRIARWTLLGVGAALVVGGVVPAWSASDARDEEARLRNADGSLPESALDRQRTLAGQAARDDVWAAVLWSTGGACLAGSAVLFALDAFADDAPSDAVAVGPASSGLGLSFTLRR